MTQLVRHSLRLDRQPLASDNERLVLDIIRRFGPIARAAITGHTNLTQQSVHRLVEGLIGRGLLRLGAPLKGARGQPSPTIELAAEQVLSLGISINTDTAIICLADFRGEIIAETKLGFPPHDRRATLEAAAKARDDMLAAQMLPGDRLIGLGFSMSGFSVADERVFNAPEPLFDWSLIDLRPILEEIFKLPVWQENNATTGAIGESLVGVGRWCDTFAYLSFNYGFGGGLILNGQPFYGFHGNAGEMSGIFVDQEADRRPALQYLLKSLQDNGIVIDTVEALYERFDPAWPGVEDWLEATMPQVERLVVTLISIIDPQAIVFGGQLPPALGQMMIERCKKPFQRKHRYGVGPKEAQLVLAEAKGDAGAIGAALLPLKMRYFV